MKSILLTITLILLIALGGANGQDKGEMLIPLSNPGTKGDLRVSVKRGSITVTGANRQDVLIKYQALESKHGDNNTDRTKDGLQRISSGSIDLEVGENGNKVSVISDSWNKGIALIIEVPKTFDLNLDTYNGGFIKVDNIMGEVILENYNGEITAKGISGSVSANTYNGEIIIELLKVSPDVPMSFSTYNGDVDITLPSSSKADFKLKTNQGEIYSGFSMDLIKSEPVKRTDSKSGTYKVYIDDWVRGKINGGGSEIVMKNYNGDIYIRKQ